MLTEGEAQQMVIGVATAMMDDDKEAREIIYSDLDADELKRCLRWSIRWMVQIFYMVNLMQGIDPKEAWEHFAMGVNNSIAQKNGEE